MKSIITVIFSCALYVNCYSNSFHVNDGNNFSPKDFFYLQANKKPVTKT